MYSCVSVLTYGIPVTFTVGASLKTDVHPRDKESADIERIVAQTPAHGADAPAFAALLADYRRAVRRRRDAAGPDMRATDSAARMSETHPAPEVV
ncbi:MAG: hypothetical protein AVDCRST_MAG77-45 [uncultured Chloroflexi bacterium]|uniref:Uncharacterized protein n=1 Tax=uncultured Chloroflexota bacterium TaxID=166587 RepID=A0A6J4H1P6_9CHLR|nr:MAG: hypothetical protein AVDCRST_MAG77-45 [uncultured Chloroflexota bacterium]